jgi:hypothetical protein
MGVSSVQYMEVFCFYPLALGLQYLHGAPLSQRMINPR